MTVLRPRIPGIRTPTRERGNRLLDAFDPVTASPRRHALGHIRKPELRNGAAIAPIPVADLGSFPPDRL